MVFILYKEKRISKCVKLLNLLIIYYTINSKCLAKNIKRLYHFSIILINSYIFFMYGYLYLKTFSCM